MLPGCFCRRAVRYAPHHHKSAVRRVRVVEKSRRKIAGRQQFSRSEIEEIVLPRPLFRSGREHCVSCEPCLCARRREISDFACADCADHGDVVGFRSIGHPKEETIVFLAERAGERLGIGSGQTAATLQIGVGIVSHVVVNHLRDPRKCPRRVNSVATAVAPARDPPREAAQRRVVGVHWEES